MKIITALAAMIIIVAAVPATAQTVVAPGVTDDATEANSQPKIGIDRRGTIYLTFVKPSEGVAQIWVASSTDGQRWTPQQVTRAASHSRYPTLAVGPDNIVHLAWTQYDNGVGKVYYSRRTDGGWSTPVKVSPGNTYAGIPALVVDPDGTVHMVWYGIRADGPPVPTRHGSTYEILYTAARGGRWREPVVISPGIPDSINPALAIDATGRLHSAWYQFDLRNYQVRYTTYDRGWTQPQTISSGHADALAVALAAGPDTGAFVVWERRESDGGRIYFAGRQQQWSRQEQLSPPSQNASNPSIAVDPRGRVYVAWVHDGQIYLRQRNRDWRGIDRVTTQGRNTRPVITAAYGTVLLAWTQQIADETRVLVITVTDGVGVPLERPGPPWGLLFTGLLAITAYLLLAVSYWRRNRPTA